MEPISIIIMLAVGAAAGFLAGLIMKGGGFGLLGNIIVGILGAIVSGFLLKGINILPGIPGQIVDATIGAIILLFIIGIIKKA